MVGDNQDCYAGFTLKAKYGYYFSTPGENGFVPADGVSVAVTNDSHAQFSSNTYDTLSVNATVKAVSRPRFAMHSISLGGDIGVNFYADIPVADRDRNDIKVVFSWKGNSGEAKTVTVSLDKTDTTNGYYKFTCNVCAAEMNDEIEARLCYGDDTVAADSYSVKQYADVILHELDKELERRGHRFVRYADDCMIFCKSRKSAERTLRNILPYIEEKLFLKANREKTCVAYISKVKYLGYSFYRHKGFRFRVHPKSVEKMKKKLKELTNRSKAWSNENRILKLKQFIKGWVNYFKPASALRNFRILV